MTAVIRGGSAESAVSLRSVTRAEWHRRGARRRCPHCVRVRYDAAMAASPTGMLAGVPLLQGLDEDGLVAVADRAVLVCAAAGRAVFRAGEPAELFYVLVAGRVKVTDVSAEGHEVILRVNGPGDAIGGVAAFVEGAEYPVTARAIEPCEALAWTGQAMIALMHRFPVIAINAARLVALRLHALQRAHHELMTDLVERRIARALLRLAEHAGRRVDGGVEIDFPLSRRTSRR